MALYSVSRGRMSLPTRLPRGSKLEAEREGAALVADTGAGRTRGPTLKANGGRRRVVKGARPPGRFRSSAATAFLQQVAPQSAAASVLYRIIAIRAADSGMLPPIAVFRPTA